MKNKPLIYQYWIGGPTKKPPPFYASVSIQQMKEYAAHFGADYRFDMDQPFFSKELTPYYEYYNAFRPVFDPEIYNEYEKVLFVDLDIMVTNVGKEMNIFEEDVPLIGICEEIQQPQIRYSKLGQSMSKINGHKDEIWAREIESKLNIKLPRDNQHRLKVFNSGVVLYTQEGMKIARNKFLQFTRYVDIVRGVINDPSFYQIDQNYLHAMLEYAFLDKTYTVLDCNKWNAQLHKVILDEKKTIGIYDGRVIGKTAFVHFQLRPRNIYKTREHLESIINASFILDKDHIK